MLSKSDIKIVERVLSMDVEQLEEFVLALDSGTKDYLSGILNQYEGTLKE